MVGLLAPKVQLCTPTLLCFQLLSPRSRSVSQAFKSPVGSSPGKNRPCRQAKFQRLTSPALCSRPFGYSRNLARLNVVETKAADDGQGERSIEEIHTSVLRNEILEVFGGVSVGNFIDGTLGMGGHSLAICEDHRSTLELLLGIDQDPAALQLASERLSAFPDQVRLVSGNFADIGEIAEENGLQHGSVDGILLDIGTSSLQLDEAARGFSFMRDGPLDMRMDPNGPLTAADIVNSWSEEEIAQVLWEFGEERKSRSMARKIVRARDEKPIETTLELCRVIGGARHGKGIHPATLAFQGLRIAVNQELHVLSKVLPQAVDLLGPGGRLAVISFHSLEDRIVKTFFREAAGAGPKAHRNKYAREAEPDPEPGTLRVVTKRPITAHPDEEKVNPRSRSAKLRVIEKV